MNFWIRIQSLYHRAMAGQLHRASSKIRNSAIRRYHEEHIAAIRFLRSENTTATRLEKKARLHEKLSGLLKVRSESQKKESGRSVTEILEGISKNPLPLLKSSPHNGKLFGGSHGGAGVRG